jgi:hypothetical protein
MPLLIFSHDARRTVNRERRTNPDWAGGQIHNAPDSPESKLVGGPIQDNPDKVGRVNPTPGIVVPNADGKRPEWQIAETFGVFEFSASAIPQGSESAGVELSAIEPFRLLCPTACFMSAV